MFTLQKGSMQRYTDDLHLAWFARWFPVHNLFVWIKSSLEEVKILLQDVDHWNARDPWHGLPFRGGSRWWHHNGYLLPGGDRGRCQANWFPPTAQVELGWMQLESVLWFTGVLFSQDCPLQSTLDLLDTSENEIADGSNSHDHGSEAKLRKPPVKLMVLGLIFSALMLLSIVTAVFYGIGKWLGRRFRHSGPLWKVQPFWDKDTVGQIVPKKFWNTKWLQCKVLTQSHSNQFWSPQHFLALCHLHVITSMPRHFVQKYRKPFRQGFRGLNMIPCVPFFLKPVFPPSTTQYGIFIDIETYTVIMNNHYSRLVATIYFQICYQRPCYHQVHVLLVGPRRSISLQVLPVPPEDRGWQYGASPENRIAETRIQIHHLRHMAEEPSFHKSLFKAMLFQISGDCLFSSVALHGFAVLPKVDCDDLNDLTRHGNRKMTEGYPNGLPSQRWE